MSPSRRAGSRLRPLRASVGLGAIGVLLLSALTSCGAAQAATPPPQINPGCSLSRTASTQTLSLNIGGRQRVVIVHLPPIKGSSDLPLVLSLHGSGNTALGQEEFSGLDATANADGFIVAYPQALIPVGTAGFDWNVPGATLAGGTPVPKTAPDDMSFLISLVGVLEQRYCVDPTRVYATGFSGGGRLVSALACDDSTVFAAVAVVSGLRRPTPCPTSRPVPVVSFHGTDDTIDPFEGGGQPYWTYSVPQAAAYWAQQDRCLATPSLQPGNEFDLTQYEGCAGGASVELYTIFNEGHEWPGGPQLSAKYSDALGPQSDAVDANAVMWSFFAAHPMAS